LVKGKIPSNPGQPGGASLRVRFTVKPDGTPTNFQTFDTSSQDWTDRALREMAAWRFRPATREGQPEEVNAVFELTVKETSSENGPSLRPRPSLSRAQVAISTPRAQDASLPAPNPIAPPDRAVFDGYLRRLTCKWDASPGAVAYLLEWDYFDQDAWHAESEGIPGVAYQSNNTEIAFDFVAGKSGRWRVWPVNSRGQRGNPSPWRTFRYVN
jgi:hypothetical protein